MCQRYHAVALAPDDHRLCPDAVEAVRKAPLRDRKQQFPRDCQLAGIADDERLRNFGSREPFLDRRLELIHLLLLLAGHFTPLASPGESLGGS